MYCKLIVNPKTGRLFWVSIPFKREGVLQVDRDELKELTSEFQFPSNGKVYCKPTKGILKMARKYVSIPFKREGVLQVIGSERDLDSQIIVFQFPSNGKVYCKVSSKAKNALGNIFVSIPFKREGVLQEKAVNALIKNHPMFQFPSNGKVYCK